MENMFYVLVMVAVLLAVVVVVLAAGRNQRSYMNAQRQSNADKLAMLDLMQRTMEGRYSDYSYVVGYYTKMKQNFGSTTYYYFPYILAFSSAELIIFPFVRQAGKLYLRNRLTVNWNGTDFRYKLRKNGMTLIFKMAGDTMPIKVDPVIKSWGLEKSDRPICVYQEQEYERLKMCLDGYKKSAKR